MSSLTRYRVLTVAFSLALVGLLAMLFWPSPNQEILNAVKSNNVPLLHQLLKEKLRFLKQTDPLKKFTSISPLSGGPSARSSQALLDPTLSRAALESRAYTINDINFGHDRSLMHAAAMHSNLSVVEFLYERGAHFDDPRVTDGRTPLHYAANYNSPEVIEALIKFGARIDQRALGGWTPLHYAVLWSNHDNAELLLKRGADPNARLDGEKRKAILQSAIVFTDWKMVKMLLEYGAKLEPGEDYYDDYTKYAKAVRLEKEGRQASTLDQYEDEEL